MKQSILHSSISAETTDHYFCLISLPISLVSLIFGRMLLSLSLSLSLSLTHSLTHTHTHTHTHTQKHAGACAHTYTHDVMSKRDEEDV